MLWCSQNETQIYPLCPSTVCSIRPKFQRILIAFLVCFLSTKPNYSSAISGLILFLPPLLMILKEYFSDLTRRTDGSL